MDTLTHAALYDLAPLTQMAIVGLVLALLPLAWFWIRHRRSTPAARLRGLTLLTLFLTFDLVLFGAFTRLSDSGLGCPDWPGCYGSASPLGARDEIHAAQTALPSGPVTHGKAWIEMIHRYAATVVGILISALMLMSWFYTRRRQMHLLPRPVSPWWATVTWLWVCMQGAFGALTVTLKLYPAIVTLHLLGGLGLLALLAAFWARQKPTLTPPEMPLPAPWRAAVWLVGGLTVAQITFGGWVSTNYAVLACTEFPTCQGQWWPAMDFAHAFQVLRPLGQTADGRYLPFEALTAIHMVHRWGAAVLFLAVTGLVVCLWRHHDPANKRWAWALIAVLAWQLLSGLSNVVLGWPLVAALAHTGGAAAMVVVLTLFGMATQPAAAAKP